MSQVRTYCKVKVLLPSILLAVLMTSSSFAAVPKFENSGLCSYLLSRKEIRNKENSVAQAKIEQLVERKLIEYGLQITDSRSDSAALRRRARQLAKKIKPYQLENESYRKALVEKIIDLKLSENLLPLDDYSLSESERLSLIQIILRTAINEGISDLPASEKSPGFRERILRASRRVTESRIYRILLNWDLPTKDPTLSEYQLALLTNEGLESLLKRKDIQELIKNEGRARVLKSVGRLAKRSMTLYFILSFVFVHYPEAQEQFAVATQAQAEKNTQAFVEDVQRSTDLDGDQLLLAAAKAEVAAIEAHYIDQFNEAPTAAESKEIREHICKVRYAEIFSAEQQRSCLLESKVNL